MCADMRKNKILALLYLYKFQYQYTILVIVMSQWYDVFLVKLNTTEKEHKSPTGSVAGRKRTHRRICWTEKERNKWPEEKIWQKWISEVASSVFWVCSHVWGNLKTSPFHTQGCSPLPSGIRHTWAKLLKKKKRFLRQNDQNILLIHFETKGGAMFFLWGTPDFITPSLGMLFQHISCLLNHFLFLHKPNVLVCEGVLGFNVYG